LPEARGSTALSLRALAGHLPEDHFADHIASGCLVRRSRPGARPFPGYHLYRPSRRLSAAFALIIDRLRRRQR